MNYISNTPENLIPDNANYFETGGIKIRKGTMAAAIANAEIIESESSSTEAKEAAIEILKSLAPQLNASGLNKHFIWQNPKIQAISDKASTDQV